MAGRGRLSCQLSVTNFIPPKLFSFRHFQTETLAANQQFQTGNLAGPLLHLFTPSVHPEVCPLSRWPDSPMPTLHPQPVGWLHFPSSSNVSSPHQVSSVVLVSCLLWQFPNTYPPRYQNRIMNSSASMIQLQMIN